MFQFEGIWGLLEGLSPPKRPRSDGTATDDVIDWPSRTKFLGR